MDKYVGEMNADQLDETTMSKENRILKKIDMNDINICARVVQGLMGESVAYRKDFIEKNAHLAHIDV